MNVLDLFVACHLDPEMTDEPTPPSLAVASPEEVANALAYALRYDERGKPRRGGWDFAAGLAAEWLTEHLRRSGFVIMRAPPGRPTVQANNSFHCLEHKFYVKNHY